MTNPGPWTDPRTPPWRRAMGLAWPVAVQQALGLAVGLTDRWIAGHARLDDGDGHLALQAAQTTCFYLSWMLASLGTLASAGVAALVSRQIGRGDSRTATVVVQQGLLVAGAAGLAGALAGRAGLEWLLSALQLDGSAGALAREYLRVTFLLLPVQLVGGTAAAALAAAGDTRTALRIAVATTLLNIPLAWVGFHGLAGKPGLGFAGMAWGTGLAQAVGAVAVLAWLVRGRAGLRLGLGGLRPDRATIARILRISLPAAAESLSMVAGQMVFLAAVNGLDDAARAAHGIALGWESVAETFGLAMAAAAVPLVGQNLGAGQPEDARRCGLAAYGLAALGMSLAGVAFHQLAEPLFRFYCPGDDQAPIVSAGVPVLRLAAFSMPALAACHVLSAALRGAGDTRFPLAFTWLGFFCVRLPLTWWLGRPALESPWGSLAGWGLGLYGCWMAMQVDLWFRGTLLLWRFSRGDWRRARV